MFYIFRVSLHKSVYKQVMCAYVSESSIAISSPDIRSQTCAFVLLRDKKECAFRQLKGTNGQKHFVSSTMCKLKVTTEI